MLLGPVLLLSLAAAPAEWREDLAFLAKELPARHVKPFARVSQKEFAAKVDALNQRIPTFSDDRIRMEFSRLVALLGDSHTNISFRGEKPQTLPLIFYNLDDGIFVIRASEEYKALLGARVTRVGRMKIDDALQAVSTFFGYENEMYRISVARNFLRFAGHLDAAGVAPFTGKVHMEAVSATGEAVAMDVTAYPPDQLPVMLPWVKAAPALSRSNPRKAYWAARVPGSNTVYFAYQQCRDDPAEPFAEFRKKLAALLDDQTVERLIVDLSLNGGGNSAILDPWIDEIKKSRFNAKGRLTVIVGRSTFSSGILNAVRLKQETAAVLIGEPTGGKPNHLGDIRTFELPHSHAVVTYSTKDFRPFPGDAPSLEPGIRVAMTSKDFAAGRDAAFEAAMAAAK